MTKPTKYTPELNERAEILCHDNGCTDEALCGHFGICQRTLYDWKRKYPEFAEAIQRGKDAFDTRVVESKLLQRACGYDYKEKEGVKVVLPDVGAISLWLKNRNPKRWRETQHLVLDDQPEEITPEQAKQLLEELENAGNGLATE